jgi:hypothetical protein
MYTRAILTVSWCIVALVCFLLSCPPLSCDTPATKTGTFYGKARPVGDGNARMVVVVDADGKPTSLGIEVTATALSKLPETDTEYVLPLPKGVSVPPYRYAVLNWNPHGHIPPGIYDVPHFDFHFYIITQATRTRMTATGADEKLVYANPPAEYVAQGYIGAPGGGEPRMGWHWVDPTSPEFNGKPFTYTFIYGFYEGHLAFLEPMARKTFLETKPDVTAKVKLPPKYEKAGYYPTDYSVKYDDAKQSYTVSMDSLVYR